MIARSSTLGPDQLVVGGHAQFVVRHGRPPDCLALPRSHVVRRPRRATNRKRARDIAHSDVAVLPLFSARTSGDPRATVLTRLWLTVGGRTGGGAGVRM